MSQSNFHTACMNGDISNIDKLLENNLDNNLINGIKLAFIYNRQNIINHIFNYSCINNKLEIIEFLLSCISDLDLQKGIELACYNNNIDIINYLIKNNSTLDLQRCLNNICSYNTCGDEEIINKIEIINYLLKIKPELDIQCGFNFVCIYNHGIELLKYLLENNSNIDIDEGFRHACTTYNILVIKYLLKLKPNLNIKFNSNKYLEHAYMNKQLDIIDKILELNLDIEIISQVKFIITNKPDNIKIKKCLYINSIYNSKKIYDCSICFEQSANSKTNCGHIFCYKCINNWYLKKNTCPTCRDKLEYCNIIS
jgi:hypothetical protein